MKKIVLLLFGGFLLVGGNFVFVLADESNDKETASCLSTNRFVLDKDSIYTIVINFTNSRSNDRKYSKFFIGSNKVKGIGYNSNKTARFLIVDSSTGDVLHDKVLLLINPQEFPEEVKPKVNIDPDLNALERVIKEFANKKYRNSAPKEFIGIPIDEDFWNALYNQNRKLTIFDGSNGKKLMDISIPKYLIDESLNSSNDFWSSADERSKELDRLGVIRTPEASKYYSTMFSSARVLKPDPLSAYMISCSKPGI